MLTTLFFISGGMIILGFIMSEIGKHTPRMYDVNEEPIQHVLDVGDWMLILGLIIFIGCVIMLMVTAPSAVNCR